MSAIKKGASLEDKVDQILDMMKVFNARQLNFAQRLNQITALVTNLNDQRAPAESKLTPEEKPAKIVITLPKKNEKKIENLPKSKEGRTSKSKKCLSSQAELSKQESSTESSTSDEGTTDDDEEYEDVVLALAKLTPTNVESVASEIRLLELSNGDQPHLADIIIKKAIDKPECRITCAQLCKILSTPLKNAKANNSDQQKMDAKHFKMVLHDRCRKRFKIADCKKEDEAIEAQIAKNEHLNFCSFLGHLFSLDMLDPTLMRKVFLNLLKDKEDSSVKTLCAVLFCVGKHYRLKDPLALHPIMAELQRLQHTKDCHQLSQECLNFINAVLNKWRNEWSKK